MSVPYREQHDPLMKLLDSQYIAPILGPFIFVTEFGYVEETMRLIGISRLSTFMQGAGACLKGAISALCAELVAAKWDSFDRALAAFPKAERRRHRLVVDLDDRHCVMVGINIEAGIAIVEFAGPRTKLTTAGEGKGRRPA